jgi:aminopeptidase N
MVPHTHTRQTPSNRFQLKLCALPQKAGTPHLHVRTAYDGISQTYTLTCRQHTPPTPGQPDKRPVLIPIRLGLLGPDGEWWPV